MLRSEDTRLDKTMAQPSGRGRCSMWPRPVTRVSFLFLIRHAVVGARRQLREGLVTMETLHPPIHGAACVDVRG